MSNSITSRAKKARVNFEKAYQLPVFAMVMDVDMESGTPKPKGIAFSFAAKGYPEIIEGEEIKPDGQRFVLSGLCTAIDQIANILQDGALAERVRKTIADFGNEQTKAA
jgi:hypothetical protein